MVWGWKHYASTSSTEGLTLGQLSASCETVSTTVDETSCSNNNEDPMVEVKLDDDVTIRQPANYKEEEANCERKTGKFKWRWSKWLPWRRRSYRARIIHIGSPAHAQSIENRYPKNLVCNQKYNIITFIPLVLFQQFKFFLNSFFLFIALSQFIPAYQIGSPVAYWGPLGFIMTVTLVREAYDDIKRFLRDRELNLEKYEKLTRFGNRLEVRSCDICVGDVIVIERDRRVPADVVLLRTTEKSGACFIRTDQLDGETDWKLRIAVPCTQNLADPADIMTANCEIYAEQPQKDVYSFVGTYKIKSKNQVHGPLNVENVLWANTVVASGTAFGVVVYTGSETRSVMNTTNPRSKVGLLDYEINNLTKILFIFALVLSSAMVLMKGVDWYWHRYLFRYILLFSYVIPISMRVNLDLAKLFYAWDIGRDKQIENTIVRSSTISEELGRIQFLLTDKTGTLTKNEMRFKKLHLGTVSFGADCFSEVSRHVEAANAGKAEPASVSARLQAAVEALAVCHNVSPVIENGRTSYQAASPDEVALVQWTDTVGLRLVHRDLHSLHLQSNHGLRKFTILHIFPFTSEAKRMGIIVKDQFTEEITLFVKGADTVMSSMVQHNDWLEEESSNTAREGLRTLVVAKKVLTSIAYEVFDKAYSEAKLSLSNRSLSMQKVVSEHLERDLQLLCLTGVEDKLQDDVTTSLEMLRNAGIKIWMLTGDKQETAICIAKSSGLFPKSAHVHVFSRVNTRIEAFNELVNLEGRRSVALVITGTDLATVIMHYEAEVAELLCACVAVVCCRCTPEQKALLVHLLKKHRPDARVAAVGDGGNDVSMIQAAHAGIGIEALEGKQASLAADFSIVQFSNLCRLLLVHGRYCYKRSSALSQFVIHRGLVISTMQAIFCCVFYFVSVSLYQGVLMMAYTTPYTMLPVLSIIFDRDVSAQNALAYPELYKDLVKGRSLTYKTFFIWVIVSIYQGCVIMYGALFAFEADFIHVVAISYTALIVTEFVMVALIVHTWHWAMLIAQALSLGMYTGSLLLFDSIFDRQFITSTPFLFKTAIITAISCAPLGIIKVIRGRISPPTYAKVQ